MEATRITAKGQITIPAEIRNRLGLLPNTEVLLDVEDDGVTIRPAGQRDQPKGALLIRHMRGRATVAMTTDEIMALTRGE